MIKRLIQVCVLILVFSSFVWAQETGFPLALQGNSPESRDVTLDIGIIPTDATDIDLMLTVFDADFIDEGHLLINGTQVAVLFETPLQDGIVQNKTIRIPIIYFNSGQNTLTFFHDSTAGYRIDNIHYSFVPPSVVTKQIGYAWDPNSEPNIVGYRLYHSLLSGQYEKGVSSPNFVAEFPASQHGTETEPWVTTQELRTTTTHYWSLTAYDTEGNESDFSNEVSLFIEPLVNTIE